MIINKNRIIKFRVWCKKSKQFLDPSVHYLTLDGSGIVYNYEDIDQGILGADIDNFIPQQFTSLIDKNNKEIYEGDILKLRNGIFKVEYKNTSFVGIKNKQIGEPGSLFHEYMASFRYIWNKEHTEVLETINESEVIGNIFESSEVFV